MRSHTNDAHTTRSLREDRSPLPRLRFVTFSLLALGALSLAPATSPTTARAADGDALESVAHAPGSRRTRRSSADRSARVAARGADRARSGHRPTDLAERPEEALPERKVFGDDDREPVDDTESYPWSTVAKVYSRFPDGSWLEGSAVMVGPDDALTAGHVIHDTERGGWADRVEVVPGFNLGDEPFGVHLAEDLRSLAGWTESQDFDFDIALIDLEDDVGDETGWLGLSSATDNALLDNVLNTAGYPADLEEGLGMWFAADYAADVDATSIYLDRHLDAAGGQSGSGLWLKDGDDRLVVGVLSTETSSANVAVRIDDELYDVIDDWLAEADGTVELAVLDVETELPVEVRRGDSGAVYVDVANDGTVAADAEVRVYAESASTSTLLGSATESVGAGNELEVAVLATVPDDLAPGDYDLVAVVNEDDVPPESDRDDNELLGPELTVLEPWIVLTSGTNHRGRIAPGGDAWFEFDVAEGSRKLKLRLRGLREGFALVERPNGSTFNLFPGDRNRRNIRNPQAGTWRAIVKLPPNALRSRSFRFKFKTK